MTAKGAWDICKGTVSEFMEDNVLQLAAALAYYAMFSIGPLLVIVIGVAGLFLSHSSARQDVIGQVQTLVGANAAKTVDSMLSAQHYGSSIVATVLGIAALLFKFATKLPLGTHIENCWNSRSPLDSLRSNPHAQARYHRP